MADPVKFFMRWLYVKNAYNFEKLKRKIKKLGRAGGYVKFIYI